MSAIDLSAFCPSKPFAYRMKSPFSRGDYSWATDGRILVRVPRRPDIAENPDAPNVEKFWVDFPQAGWCRPVVRELPTPKKKVCTACGGRGRKHECPECECTCEECDGLGLHDEKQAVTVGERAVQLHHARMIVGLDWLEIVPPAKTDHLLLFQFEDGQGIICLLFQSHGLRIVGSLT